MDPEVLAVLRRAERALGDLVRDAERRPPGWEERTRLLVTLEQIATRLVEASRRYAEQLSHEAGAARTEPSGSDDLR